MSGGEIAAIIAAGAFVLLVLFIGVPLIKLGGLIDDTRESVRDLNDAVAPLLTEVTTTVIETNKALAKIDTITENVADVTTNVKALVALFSASVGAPLMKIAGLTQGLRSALLGKKK
ncbi:MAG: DUF948 domain-containing protein [Rhodoluna sp.]|nr:DUF948 domain-containing protein [Rhodoluna sp.]